MLQDRFRDLQKLCQIVLNLRVTAYTFQIYLKLFVHLAPKKTPVIAYEHGSLWHNSTPLIFTGVRHVILQCFQCTRPVCVVV